MVASDPSEPGAPAARADSLSGVLLDGRWRLGERLGAGGMGVVYRGMHDKLHKPVAIKLLDRRFVTSKQAVARFHREARAISRLAHPSCVAIRDYGVDADRPFIVMELVSGRSLGQVMSEGLLPLPRAVQIVRQILSGLGHAHAHGVVHRDLKPDNVMLAEGPDGSDVLKILDFGLARIISADEVSLSLPAQIAGTPSYMSPEQAAGERVDHRTDFYSAGILLYGLCVGRKPFSTSNAAEMLRLHRHQAPPRPRDAAPDRGISELLERVILKALSKDRAQRFYRAADFLEALDRTPEGRVATGQVPALPEHHRGRFALLLALGGAAALAGAWALRGRMAPPAPAPAASALVPKIVDAAVAPDLAAALAPPEAEEPDAAPTDEPAAAARSKPPVVATPNPLDATLAQARRLLASGDSHEAELLLRALPRSAAAHLELARLYHTRLWRKDALAEWEAALRLDPSLRKDPQLGAALCTALGPKWRGGGARLLIRDFGADAIAPMTVCLRSAPSPEERRAAARVIERVKRR